MTADALTPKSWEDMEWFWDEQEPDGSQADHAFGSFCLCLVEGEDAPDMAGAVTPGTMSFNKLSEHSYEDWDPSRLLVGRAQLDGWTMFYEVNGFAGVENTLMEPITAGRRAYSLWHSAGNMHNTLSVFDDGRCVLTVEPDMPSSLVVDWERGALADDLVTRLENTGFLTDAAGDEDPDEIMDRNMPASLAFLANETGTDITPALVRSATFAVTTVDAEGTGR